MPSYSPRLRRSKSPVTITSALAVTAHSSTRSSSGSLSTTCRVTVGTTVAAAVPIRRDFGANRLGDGHVDATCDPELECAFRLATERECGHVDVGAGRPYVRPLLAGLSTRLRDQPGDVGLGQAELVGALLAVLLEAIQLPQGQVRNQGIPRDLVGGLALGLRFLPRLLVELVGQGDGPRGGHVGCSLSNYAPGWP